MKIGFDLDGVLCDTEMNFLWLLAMTPPFAEDLEKRIELELWYFHERRPLLDPERFVSEGDEYYVVTGRDNEIHGEVTERWCRKHVPNAKGASASESIGNPSRRPKPRKYWSWIWTYSSTITR